MERNEPVTAEHRISRTRMPVFARNMDTADLLENFIITAMSSIIAVRVYLHLTGYPQIGFRNLHIAHILWGGLFMAIALILSLGFLNKEARRFSVITGGIGFGLFIDEIGKIVTRDNNYFFHPSFVIMYVMFVFLFLASRIIMRVRPFSEREYAINAMETMKEIIYYDMDEDERLRALSYLRKSDRKNPLVKSLHGVLSSLNADDVGDDTELLTRMKRRMREVYVRKISKGKPVLVITVAFLAILLVRLAVAAVDFPGPWSFWETGRQLSLFLVFLGVLPALYYRRRGHRLQAFFWFKRSIVAYILLVQFFDFYYSQLSAFVGLCAAVLAYAVLQYLIAQERGEAKRRAVARMA